MIKTYLEKMLLKHENSIDKVVQTFSSTLKGNILFFFLMTLNQEHFVLLN